MFQKYPNSTSCCNRITSGCAWRQRQHIDTDTQIFNCFGTHINQNIDKLTRKNAVEHVFLKQFDLTLSRSRSLGAVPPNWFLEVKNQQLTGQQKKKQREPTKIIIIETRSHCIRAQPWMMQTDCNKIPRAGFVHNFWTTPHQPNNKAKEKRIMSTEQAKAQNTTKKKSNALHAWPLLAFHFSIFFFFFFT